MTTEPTSAYFAKADAGFATTAMFLIESIFLLTGFHLAGKCSSAQRDNERLRENVACPPFAA
jgi:hypothetical protein